jgi:predicted permease
MRVWHALGARLRSLFQWNRREADLREELQLHLEREAERLEAGGLSTGAARPEARRRFGGVGPVEEAGRGTRGTAWRAGTARDVRFAWRSFRRAPLVAATIVLTVGLGLGLVTAVFTFFNVFVFRVDNVHDPYSLFAVVRERSETAPADGFTRSQYDDLIRETNVFTGAFAQTQEFDAWIEGRRMEGTLTTGNFFGVLGVRAARGRTFTSADDEPGGARVVVLSHRAWMRFFDGDAGVVGRLVRVNDMPFHVLGVMPEGFRGLTVGSLDFWAPLSLASEFSRYRDRRQDTLEVGIVGRLAPGVSPEGAVAQVRTWDARRAAERGADRPVATLVLEPRLGTVPQPLEAVALFTPLFLAFGLVLLIGCANVANLLFARAVARQREIGIRLAIGASRGRIVRQLLTESLLLALTSAAFGFVVSRLVLAAIVYAVLSTFPPEFGDIRLAVPAADWRVALFLVAGAMASTLFFALAPALQATRVELVQAIRGDVTRGGHPGRARNALIGLQVAGSALLLTCAAVFLRSTLAAADLDPGIRVAGTLSIAVLDEQKRGVVLDVLKAEPAVTAVAASWPGGLGGRQALAEGAAGAPVTCQFVSPEYFDVLGIEVVRGRGFADTERSPAAAVAVVSETVAKRLWPGLDAVGQVLRLAPDPSTPPDTAASGDPRDTAAHALLSRTAVVVGVTRDVAGFGFGDERTAGPGVYVPIDTDAPRASLVALARGDAERVRHGLVERMASLDPNMAEIATLATMMRMVAYFLALPFWLTLVLGSLALLLTVSGLFSVLSYLVEQRTREIGVRMALGATRRRIATLVLSDTARPVGIGLLVGAGFTGVLGAVLLATPAAGLIAPSVRLFDPVAYAGSLLCIVAACVCAALIPARRAGRIEPLSALRKD